MPFHDQVIYQVYPKSFYDSDGDGLGDIKGIIQKIPYIASLGVDMVWFNPFFASPQRDNGYDISDYLAINPDLGTMADVEEMIATLKEHNIQVMFDMVFNHISTEHVWFQKALAGEKKYQDFFYIRPPKADGSMPTNWESKFGGEAWAPFGNTGDYFLCLYDKTQADLNWHNPAVRQELYKVANFWLEKGVRGLRFDVLNVIGKSEFLEDAPPGMIDKLLYTDTPRIHPWIHEMNQNSFGKFNGTITVGEMSSTTIENSIQYSKPENQELDMVFNFHHLKVDYEDGKKWTRIPFDFHLLKGLFNDWALGMQDGGGWNALFWNNHDQPRALDRFGDPKKFREESATMLATVIHLHRGTPYIYQGEEIGMVDPAYTHIEQYEDIEARNAYVELIAEGLSETEAFPIVHSKARDNSRTPMQWDSSANAGFTTGSPWLEPTTYQTINVEHELKEGKVLPYYKKLIKLRKENRVISHGTYAPYDLEHPSVYAYIREHHNEKLLVINNFFGENTSIEIPAEFTLGQILISNYEREKLSEELTLEPYEALAIKI
ncbi:MAG: alpha,alpha-phosphotrehalase [Rothia sp. (in: high G+C Gram-positive bacteria)]|nr:alpha,alpha-phosphotrehalase [Rothia sp. (in: high G+C Gram-positive bacteria)]